MSASPEPRPATSESPDARWWILVSGAFLFFGIHLYLPAITSYFSSDDFLHIGTVIEGGIPFAPTDDGRGFLRPIVGWSFWLEYQLWGTQPAGYHASNVAVHLLNSLLVLKLALILLPAGPRQRRTAFCAGFIFLIMACHAEPVAWISGRTDLYAGFFSLLTLCMVAHSIRNDVPRVMVASVVPFVLALLSKESALALPLLIVAIALLLRHTGQWRVGRRSWYAALTGGTIVLVVYFAVRYWALGSVVAGYGVQGHLRFNQDLIAQSTSRFLWRVFLPPLPAEAGNLFRWTGSIMADVFSAALCLQFLMWARAAWKKPALRTGFFLYGAFWLALLPVINIRIQWTNVESERFLYLATIFAAMGVAYLLYTIPNRLCQRIAIVAFLLFQAACLWGNNQRWHQAAQFAQEVTTGIQTVENVKRVILANKPDSYDGALVLRTGLEEGVHYFGENPNPDLKVEVLFATTLYQPDHDFSLQRLVGGTGEYRIATLDPSSVMVEEDYYDSIDILEGDERGYRFLLRAPLKDSAIVAYSFRGIRQLDEGTNTLLPANRRPK